MKKIATTIALQIAILCLAVALPTGLMAAGIQAPMPSSTPENTRLLPNQPDKKLDRVTPVGVQLDGTDSIGSRLGMRLKERFNQSNLFSLRSEESEGVKIWLQVKTQPEFPGRPGAGSVWAVSWLFSQGKGYLRYLLSQEIGTVTPDEIDELVDRLVERTDGVAAKYSNLMR